MNSKSPSGAETLSNPVGKYLEVIEIKKFPTFRLHHLRGHIQSMFLVEYPDKLLLLDGGCRCDSKTIREYITLDLDRDLEQLKVTVVSHMHPDHSGGASSLRSKTACRLAAHPDHGLWYKGFSGFVQHKVDTYLAWWVSKKQGRQKRRVLFPRHLRPDYILADGESIPGFPDWTFIHTPGHTSHDACLFHEETGIFYAGDMVVRIKNKFLPPFPVTIPEAMCRSLKRISEMNLKVLLLAHGGMVNLEHTVLDFDSLCNKINENKGLAFKIATLGTFLSSEIRRAKRRKWDYH